ncbi:hypothetical protein ACU4HD_12085 [Cupriavidus basilensis]
MARIRSIKPEYWTSEQVMEVSRDARLMFIGLWTFCDDGGNHPASPKTLKAEVFPGDDDVTASQVMQWIDELIEQQLLVEYEVDGKEFWHVTGWHHQRIDQPTLRHPAGDAGDTGDAGDARHRKRLGGKQRQLILKKLRDRDGDACHLCGDTSGLTIARVTDVSPENPHEISNLKLICPSCKRKTRAGDAQVTQGDARCLDGDSPTEGRGVESSRVDVNTFTNPDGLVVDSDSAADFKLIEGGGKTTRPECPHQQIIALYHELLPMCPAIRDWTPARQTHLRTRWSEDPKRQNLDYWRNLFTYISESSFLTGHAKTAEGRKPFIASLDWIVKSENFTKIREGRYEDKAA